MEPAYEFDAPKYWIDFDTIRDGTEGDDDADNWFLQHTELEDDVEGSNLNPEVQRVFSSDFTPRPVVKEEPQDGGQEDTVSPLASSKLPVIKKERDNGEVVAPRSVKSQQRNDHHPVVPKTPEHLRRYLEKKQRRQVKRTREEMEAEEIEKMQEETKKKLKENRKSFQRLANSAKRPKVMKYSKPTTESVGFNFRTDRRLRKRGGGNRRPPAYSSGLHPSTFPMTLRSASKSVVHSEGPPKKCTAVKPFNFQLETRIMTREARRKQEASMAKSSTELEEEELLKIRSNPFKSQPLNPRIFTEQGLLGVPKKPNLPLTQPVTPKLATKERGEARSAFPQDEDHDKCHIIVAQPLPDFSRKYEPHLSHKKTEPDPFTFEVRDKDKPTRETFIQQILQKERRPPFRANPLPDFDGPILPVVRKPPVTDPKTPTLLTKTRGREYEGQWLQKLDEMAQKAKENATFQAKDAKVLYKPPFTAAKSERPMTELSNYPVLHTELRSEQRAKFDADRVCKEHQQEQETRERQALAEAEEAKKIASLRRSMVHKAFPIRHYNPTVILPSSKPLVVPHSPQFHIRLRSMH